MGSRTWIKIYCDKWLNGTIREETLEVRAVWVDLLVLAGSGKYGDSGEIKITDSVGLLDQQLADLLGISRQKWATIKKRLIETDRIIIKNLDRNGGVMSQNLNTAGGVMTKNSNVIAIKNWSKYQSEYKRQSPYRQAQVTIETPPEKCNQKLQREVTTESTTGDRDKRLEKEKENRDTPLNPPESSVSSSTKVTELRKETTVEDVLKLYREKICEPGEDVENDIKLAVIQFSAAWVSDAINLAGSRGKKHWSYIAGILKNWKRWGKVTKDRRGFRRQYRPPGTYDEVLKFHQERAADCFKKEGTETQ